MRLKSSIWVAAYLRRCEVAGSFAVMRKRGAEEAGAIFIKVDRLDGTSDLFGPAPQTSFDDAKPTDRLFVPSMKTVTVDSADAEEYLAKQLRYDPDIWIVEVEDRQGRNFLDDEITR
ncbi:hypothetical protein GJW-30_1_03816 [Variibacter gotjawalensis]|jgi:hypothetical protein|uniref:DUF1491 family protein n=1 Tax=Variibacter gotjawalensis TaxID=1333996 RepID=A0A0S3PZC1_9BRAD|nr:DUF1491 family protein [Variibacter gotjawalensis]NIK47097.1 hypothetical protein [Variibacter gotjawalensis]RZS48999.1 hypothetical protein EV661_1423 [Variibacter gotjawalensis]BAT61259.1 hypothetical protein GJW-30_1_03816 [Variibacter gotjawalensis]